MSDNAASYGFRWMKGYYGRDDLEPIEEFVATGFQANPSGINVDLNVGDPIKRVSDGSIALCATGDACEGVIVGIGPFFDATNGVMKIGRSLPGGTAWGTITARRSVVYVVPIAGQIFEVDVDDNTTFTTEANYLTAIGENADISINPVAGVTKAFPKLKISTHATTNTLVWRIIGLAKSSTINLDPSGLNYKLLVTGNVVQTAPFQTTGV